MRNIAKFIVPALAALAFAAAGCGGNDETTTVAGASGATGVSGAPLTQDEFIAQADAICKSANQDIEQQANDVFGGGQPTAADVEQFANAVLVPNLQDQVDQLRALTPPEGDEDQINAMIDDLDSAASQVEDDPSLLQGSDNSGPFADVNQQAEDYGLKVCGQG